VLLKDISRVTMEMEVGRHGMVGVITDQREVIGLPRHEQFDSDAEIRAAFLKTPRELGIPVIVDASDTFQKKVLPADGQLPAAGTVFPFTSGGQRWWLQGKPFRLSDDLELRIIVLIPEADLLGDIAKLRVFIAIVTLIVLIGALVRAVMLARHYSQPLEELAQGSDRISAGDLEPAEPIRSPIREIGRLAKAQERMRTALRSLMKLERDLQLARQIQQNTFPKKLPELAGFDLAAYSDPAEETGGDSYDVIGYRGTLAGEPVQLCTAEADRAVLLLGDATGHGIGPALSATQIRAMLRMAVRSGETLNHIAYHLNEQLCADLGSGRFITAWLGLLDANEHSLASFSAGQAPLLRYDAAEDSFDVLDAHALPFGIVEDMEVEPSDPIAMRPGDIFAVISDGIFEAVNNAGEQFAVERTKNVIHEHCKDSAEQILQALREAVADFTDNAPAEDDRTVIIIKRV
jgi:serine phosphatase RsbU (regulator of sigma subunit)